jgi:hypothetical protein
VRRSVESEPLSREVALVLGRRLPADDEARRVCRNQEEEDEDDDRHRPHEQRRDDESAREIRDRGGDANGAAAKYRNLD